MILLDKWQKEILQTEGNILLCSGRQVGKSTIVANKAAIEALKRKCSILIISATERQAEELFIKTLMAIEDRDKKMIKTGKDRPTKHIMKLKNGSIIRCLPTGLAGTGIRGFTIDLLIADECAWINEDVWLAVKPMLLTTGGSQWYLSTPHGRAGFFWERYNDKNFKVFHVNSEEVIRSREISITWTERQKEQALAFLEQEKRTMSSLQYAQEYLGEFVDELRQFFPDELVKKCMLVKRTDGVDKTKKYYLGIDVARLGSDETRFEILDGSDKNNLIHVENILLTKTYLNEVYNKVLELDRVYKFSKIYIDTGGIGVGVFDFLLEHPQTKRKIIPINNREMVLDHLGKRKKKILKEDLYNNLLGLMERGEIKLLDDDDVFMSFKSVQYEYDLRPNALTKLKIFGNYTHIVEGLIRAAWCKKDKALNLWVA